MDGGDHQMLLRESQLVAHGVGQVPESTLLENCQ